MGVFACVRACVRACCAMLRWCDAWSGGRATGTGREDGAAGGKTLRVWGGGARGEDPRAWAAPRLIALPWLPTAPSHAAAAPAEQAYFILDEVLLAGELQEPSKKARRGWGGVGWGGASRHEALPRSAVHRGARGGRGRCRRWMAACVGARVVSDPSRSVRVCRRWRA